MFNLRECQLKGESSETTDQNIKSLNLSDKEVVVSKEIAETLIVKETTAIEEKKTDVQESKLVEIQAAIAEPPSLAQATE